MADIRVGLSRMFQDSVAKLEEDLRKIDFCGTDFWEQATWELERWKEHVAREGPKQQ